MSDNPHGASRFECYRIPFPFVVESGSSNIDSEADGVIRLFLFECGAEAIGAGLTEQAGRSRLGDHCVPNREG